ncbi:MAG: hypothetical protein HYY25_13355 [Candidatus Wallbacteria bacterium]|nr:hypothetical protein [Candidatus Wallbacteria bacterium]
MTEHPTRTARRWLRVRDLMAEYGLSRSAAYRLKPFVAWQKKARIGLRFLRASVDAYYESDMHLPRQLAPESTSRPRTSVASEPDWMADARRFDL